MFDTLAATVPQDKDLPLRAWWIDVLTRVLNGTIYSGLMYEFREEQDAQKKYIPIHSRKPSVQTGLIRTVVDDSVSLLFSEGHFPSIQCEDDGVKDALSAFTKDSKLNLAMIDAATRGSVGSVAIVVRFLSKRVFLDVMPTGYLTPTWDPKEPDKLQKVTELRKVTGKDLAAAGYGVKADSTWYWFQREWDSTAETWYQPRKVNEKDEIKRTPVVDAERTVQHNLKFVPVVWVKNLPGGNGIDGEATFGIEAINTVIEADYQLSQAGRGLKYSQEPTLVIKDSSDNDGSPIVRSAANAISVSEKGDAKLLEINGTAAEAVLAYVQRLREFALERMHGNRSNADKLSAAQSGRALELMHQALIWLADKLRSSYGEGALLDVYRMVIAGSAVYPLTIDGVAYGKLATAKPISLKWPAWFSPTADDIQTLSTALATLIRVGALSRETAIKAIAAMFDIEDVKAEQALIDAERKALLAEMPEAQTKVAVTE